MRWKLLILSSLIVSLVSASGWFVLSNLILRSALILPGNWLYLQSFVLILIASVLGIYIYRHTSQRRKTQAISASLLTLFLIFGFTFVFVYLADLISQNSS